MTNEQYSATRRVFFAQYLESSFLGAETTNRTIAMGALPQIMREGERRDVRGYSFLTPTTKCARAYLSILEQLPKIRPFESRTHEMAGWSPQELSDHLLLNKTEQNPIFLKNTSDEELLDYIQSVKAYRDEALVVVATTPLVNSMMRAFMRQQGIADTTIATFLSLKSETSTPMIEYRA